MTSLPRVLVGILSYESPSDTIATAEALRLSTYPNFDLLVVDNASPSGCAGEIARLCPWLPIECNVTNGGYAAGMNSILERASQRGYDYALLCNNDILIAPTAVQQLVETAEANGEVALVGGVSKGYRSDAVAVAGGASFDLVTGRVKWSRSLPSQGHLKRVLILQGALILFRISAYRAGLAMDERLFMYFEELDLSIKMRRMGFQGLIDTRVVVRHKGVDRGFVTRNAYLQQRNRVYLVRVHGSRLQFLLHILVVGFVELPIKALVRTVQGQRRFARACLLGFVHGLRGRMGIGAFTNFERP